MARPYLDGEQIPDDDILNIYLRPPSVPKTFYRNSLIVGSKGAGKSTLFRYLKNTHIGLAFHMSLLTELGSVIKETGRGMLSIQYPRSLERLIIGKTISVLATSIALRAAQKTLSIPRDPLFNCLPIDHLKLGNLGLGLNGIAELHDQIISLSLEYFKDIPLSGALPAFVSAIGEIVERKFGAFLLMLDRADMVPAPAVVPVIELLDQSSHYVALVSTRPGHGGEIIDRLTGHIIPGDMYDIVHLGLEPRTTEWEDFIFGAIEAQFGQGYLKAFPDEIKDFISTISRDSIRTMLRIFAATFDTAIASEEKYILSIVNGLSRQQMLSCRKTLRPYHDNISELINSVRNEIIQKHGRVDMPALLTIKSKYAESLFDTTSNIVPFIEASLRSGALTMPDGEHWIPGNKPSKLEIPPILMWQEGDTIWSYKGKAYYIINKKENEVLHIPRPRKKLTNSVFIAYRMKFSNSDKFREDIEDAMKMHPDLSEWKVVDGRSILGAYWPDTIRKKLRKAKVLVADVTNTRPDVIFEYGFAAGLRKYVIPVVETIDDREKLPYWLRATQSGHYSTHSGILQIITSIAAISASSRDVIKFDVPSPVAGLAVWLGKSDWDKNAAEIFSTAAGRESLKSEIIEESHQEEYAIQRGSAASLLVICLTGKEADALYHFVAGAVIANEKVGYMNKLARTILVYENQGMSQRSLVAESLARCIKTVKVVRNSEEIRNETIIYGIEHREWAKKK